MSSTISQTEMLVLPTEQVPELEAKKCNGEKKPHQVMQTAQKRPHLMRSSSVDKIIKFNAYICSQNYYILPALLLWLKTSQNAVSNQTEKSIMFIKSACLATTIYKFLAERLQVAERWQQCLQRLREAPQQCRNACAYASNNGAALAVYASIALILLQFFSCLLVLVCVFVPAGFLFMVCCMYAMGHIAASAMFHHMKQEERRQSQQHLQMMQDDSKLNESTSTARLSRQRSRTSCKPFLTDRTISNITLF